MNIVLKRTFVSNSHARNRTERKTFFNKRQEDKTGTSSSTFSRCFFDIRPNLTASRDIPRFRHFCSRQYWQRFRFILKRNGELWRRMGEGRMPRNGPPGRVFPSPPELFLIKKTRSTVFFPRGDGKTSAEPLKTHRRGLETNLSTVQAFCLGHW